jgi:hypothetical protein
MSHHLGSELAGKDNRLDLTDQYVFRGETETVFVLDVRITSHTVKKDDAGGGVASPTFAGLEPFRS